MSTVPVNEGGWGLFGSMVFGSNGCAPGTPATPTDCKKLKCCVLIYWFYFKNKQTQRLETLIIVKNTKDGENVFYASIYIYY